MEGLLSQRQSPLWAWRGDFRTRNGDAMGHAYELVGRFDGDNLRAAIANIMGIGGSRRARSCCPAKEGRMRPLVFVASSLADRHTNGSSAPPLRRLASASGALRLRQPLVSVRHAKWVRRRDGNGEGDRANASNGVDVCGVTERRSNRSVLPAQEEYDEHHQNERSSMYVLLLNGRQERTAVRPRAASRFVTLHRSAYHICCLCEGPERDGLSPLDFKGTL